MCRRVETERGVVVAVVGGGGGRGERWGGVLLELIDSRCVSQIN